jgi:hypothetical protein
MGKNDRFVVKHEEGWAVKKRKVGRASSIHETQREAEKRQKKSLPTLEVGKSGFRVQADPSEMLTQCSAAMIRTHRVTAATDVYVRTATFSTDSEIQYASPYSPKDLLP